MGDLLLQDSAIVRDLDFFNTVPGLLAHEVREIERARGGRTDGVTVLDRGIHRHHVGPERSREGDAGRAGCCEMIGSAGTWRDLLHRKEFRHPWRDESSNSSTQSSSRSQFVAAELGPANDGRSGGVEFEAAVVHGVAF